MSFNWSSISCTSAFRFLDFGSGGGGRSAIGGDGVAAGVGIGVVQSCGRGAGVVWIGMGAATGSVVQSVVGGGVGKLLADLHQIIMDHFETKN